MIEKIQKLLIKILIICVYTNNLGFIQVEHYSRSDPNEGIKSIVFVQKAIISLWCRCSHEGHANAG